MDETKLKDILVINDSPTLNALLKLTLEAENFSVDFALTGMDGLEFAKLSSFRLILLDYVLPDISGVEVCKLLRRNQLTLKTPIAFITAIEENKIADELKKAGADIYIHPPYMGKIFINKIKEIILS